MEDIDDLDEIDEMDDMDDLEAIPMNKTVLNFPVRAKLKLSEVEDLIRKNRIIIPCPSRQTLIGLCEDGTFETAGKTAKGEPQPTKLGWLVFEDSFLNWVNALDGAAVAA